ncbi:MAG TPA: exostosin family protein [Granulicella sp.]|jgi:hypothetical protein|nr:exostosin family protein [Granulicella sp.]
MKIHLVCLREGSYAAMLQLAQQAEPRLHTLVEDPASADMILFVGGWKAYGEGVADSPLPRLYPEKTFIYLDDDGFTPLLPGVYTNAERPGWWSGWLGSRAESQMFVDVLNPRIRPMQVEKKYLFSFAGGSTSLLRKRLYRVRFGRPDVWVENTSNYYHWDPSQPGREERQRQYAERIASSHFGLCPRGASAGGLRLYEVMQMGVAPVVISDRLLLPEGPDWESFAIRVPERRIKQLDRILERHLGESEERGRLARAAYEQWFAPEVVFNHVVAACERRRAERRIPERWVQPFWGYMLWRVRLGRRARGLAKQMVLGVFRLLGRRFIYELNAR